MKCIKYAYFVLLFICLLSLVSCRYDKTDSFSVAEQIIASDKIKNIPAHRTFSLSGAQGNLSEYDFCYLYTGNYGENPLYCKIDSLTVIQSVSDDVFELHIIKMRSEDDTDNMAALLSRRAKLLNFYDYIFSQSESEYFFSAPAKVYVCGKFAILTVTNENEVIYDILKTQFGETISNFSSPCF